MHQANRTRFLSIFLLSFFFITGCGGGGGGGGGSNSSSADDILITSNGFTATSENKISNGQKEFAFGQTAHFIAEDLNNPTWSSIDGSIDSTGQYFTPKNLVDIATDTITLTAGTIINSREVSLTPFPSLVEGYFSYNSGNQRYAITDLTSSQAICIGTFQNDSNSSNEGNIKIKNLQASSKKMEPELNKKMLALTEKVPNFRSFDKKYFRNPLKYAHKKNRVAVKSLKSKRADDPIGTRDRFYSSFSNNSGYRDFEKIYSGDKCLIYSEVDSLSNLPFINTEKGNLIGDAFELTNPYHPEGKPIFDVVTTLFGNPWGIDKNGLLINDGGADGEKQVIILLYDGDPSIGGYFTSLDEEPQGFTDPDTGEVSNGAEIINLNQIFVEDELFILPILAHEFQHLCHYNQIILLDGVGTTETFADDFNFDRLTLFDEGLAVLSEELNGFSMQMANNKGNGSLFLFANLYLSTMSTFSPPFISWASGGDYGKGYLFWRYIYDTYGEETVKIATHNHLIPPENIETATGKKFDVLLQEFILAILQSDSSQPIQSKIKISTIDRSKDYYDTKGELIGNFIETDYIIGFPNNAIKSENPYEIRLYKVLPLKGEVRFTLENIKDKSTFSIFPVIIDK